MILPALLPGLLYWIVSYPKSGNTWMRFLLRDYLETPHWFSDAEASWYEVYNHFVGGDLPEGLVDQACHRPLMGYRMRIQCRADEDGEHQLDGRDRPIPAFVKSHHAAGEVGGLPLFAPAFCAGAIVLVRDPRDILPSFADHMGQSHAETLETMARPGAVLHHDSGVHHVLGSWSHHVLSWTRQERVPTIQVCYEDLHANPYQELHRVLEWLGVDPKPRRIRAVVNANAFEALQAREAEDGGFVERTPHQEQFFRRGQVGGWVDEVDPDIIDTLERTHGEAMDALGYPMRPASIRV